MITLKEPWRFATLIICGAIAFGFSVEAGVAFFVGAIVGSFSLETW